MADFRKNIASNLGTLSDQDLIDYVLKMEKKGVNNSRLIKQALRFYRDYGNKVKQLDIVDIANIMENEEVKDYINTAITTVIENSLHDITREFPMTTSKKKNDPKDKLKEEILQGIRSIEDLSR